MNKANTHSAHPYPRTQEAGLDLKLWLFLAHNKFKARLGYLRYYLKEENKHHKEDSKFLFTLKDSL